jgi:flagellar hook-associated protein 2
MMMGDSTLNSLKASLQRISSSSYKSGTGSAFTMLSQIGISTKSTAGAGVEASRLRGYLEIDEKKLDDALANKIQDVKSLFGSDTDGDLIIDTGIGKALDSNITPYVQSGGILATRTTGLEAKISTTQKKIGELDVQLDDKKAALKTKYGEMEGTLNNLQSQSSSISNFSRQGSN